MFYSIKIMLMYLQWNDAIFNDMALSDQMEYYVKYMTHQFIVGFV